MVIIFDSVDAVGKDTQINELTKKFHKIGKVVHTLHYSNIKAFDEDYISVRDFSVSQYNSIFNFIKDYAAPSKDIFFLNRCHLSEYVYSPIYRNYDGFYVFASERILKDNKNIILFSFTGDPKIIIERDKNRGDGNSFSLDLEKKKQELKKFNEAFDLSKIYFKKMVSIDGKDIHTITNELSDYISECWGIKW